MGHVQIIATGGTIASLPQENGDVKAAITGDELIKRLGINENVQVKSSLTIGSFALDFEKLYMIALDVIHALKSPDVSGIVVTHGTDTMEETAFYLSLVTSNFKKPVVMTGAQMNASQLFGDGAINLRDAIYVAKSENSINLGTVLVFAGFIYSAREVTKVDTSALMAFASPGWGPIGRVDGDNVVIVRQGGTKSVLSLSQPKPVILIRLGLGVTGEEFRQMAKGYAGVVIEAFGRGNAHPTICTEVEQLVRQKIPVIITSRCQSGTVFPIYGGGGGKDLERAGAWFGGDLSGEKARILLGLLLSNKVTWDEMREMVRAFSQP